MHDLACDSTHEANVTSSHKGNVLELGQDVVVCVMADKSLKVLLRRRFTVLLLDKAFCVSGAIVTHTTVIYRRLIVRSAYKMP